MVEAMEIPKGYKKTEVGIIPEDWEVKKLGEIANIVKGQLITANTAIPDGIPVIGGGMTISYFHNKPNRTGITITVSASGAYAGYVSIHNYPIFASDCSTINESESYDIFFLYYSLLNKQKEIYGLQTGGGQPHVYPEQLRNLFITIPKSKAEQTAIATVLSDTDALIQKLEQLIAKKRNIKTAAMQQLLKPKEGWKQSILASECDLITKGTTPTSIGRDFQNSGINFIKIESLTDSGKIIKEKVAFIDNYTYNLLKRSQLKSGDTLFSIAGALGRVAIVSDDLLPANTNQALAIIRLKKDSEINLRYLFYFLNSRKIQNLILSINVQGAQANLSLVNIAEFIIEHPDKSEQNNIAQILSDMDKEIEALEKQLEKYKMLKQGMMQVLLTGKIRLNR